MTMLAFSGINAAQTANPEIKLAVVRDGQAIPVPGQIAITVEGQQIEVPIVEGVFHVPLAATRAKLVDLSVEFAEETIRIPALDSSKFRFSKWTLLMANKNYGDGYQSEILPGTDVRRTCMLEFGGPDFEGVITVVDECRTKTKPSPE